MSSAFDFTPDAVPQMNADEVPYIEDVRTDKASGYRTDKSPEQLQREVTALIAQLGGAAVRFVPGAFGIKPKRYGYIVEFVIINANRSAIPCRIPIAGLPMRAETPARKQQVLAQVLYVFRENLQGELNALRYRPGYAPFAAHMVLPETNLTMMETLAERAGLLSGAPLLPTGGDR
ncbi:MAG: hypothetical protein IPK17_38610 [Chloroflexi bacterium]|uniref:hypothetical protein n=1 Tax=Candidatus Flexifilum breve TaxID=3140694 RepID=UPI0031349502|nr:hypothetical protein [Chloroflexota bacterium]